MLTSAHVNYADSFGLQWNRYSRVQLDSFNGSSLSADRLKAATHWPDDLTGQTIVEAGSGAGRFTEHLAKTGATVLTFDLSSAIEANRRNNGHFQNVRFFQADINNLDLAAGCADKVLCLGVLQHTPDPRRSFLNLANLLKPGGEIAVDIYALRLTALLHWKSLLRPFTRRMNKQTLHRLISLATPPLIPISAWLGRIFGKAGTRLFPIAQYEQLGLPPDISREWAVLDTFDMYSPTHDRPATKRAVRRWFQEAGLRNVVVENGLNGIVARGIKPLGNSQRTERRILASPGIVEQDFSVSVAGVDDANSQVRSRRSEIAGQAHC
jgi:2-polyprenyl-3-methyl-5-hydroxy-6-metoxy-1,4-benzoquinol methylase